MPKSKTVLEGRELRRGVTDDFTLNQAFQLAHSIYRYKHSDREIALEVLWQALMGLDVRLVAQHEADRHEPQKPTKVRWKKAQWFQIAIYCKSETYERHQEANDRQSLSQVDMIIRYVKHLILTTSRRNSFHISLGLSRLLYDYRAAESMAIYDLVFQDPDSSTRKADAYYRARKNKLIEELTRRFSPFLRISEGRRGEKMFARRSDSSQYVGLLNHYLTLFTPWETYCELPPQLATWTPVHALQTSQGSQIHSLIHPPCFSKITEALRLDPPERRLALPQFFLIEGTDNNAGPTEGGSAPSELSQAETTDIRNRLADQRERRRKFTPRSLSLLVDGIECARLDLAHSSRLCLDAVEEDITMIELLGSDEAGELLLATHVFMFEEDNQRQGKEYSIVLEGGQKITLTISMASEHSPESSVEIRYQETRAIRAAELWLRQVGHRLSETSTLKKWTIIPALGPKLVVVVLALLATGVILYVALRSRSGEHIAKQQPAPSNIETGNVPLVGPATTPQIESMPERRPTVVEKPQGSLNDRSKFGGTTREQTERAIRSLSEVKRVYVEPLGPDAFSQNVRQALIEKLQAGERIVILRTPDEADTAITGTTRRTATTEKSTDPASEVGSITLQLVNVAGDIMWRSRKYRGTAGQVAEEFMNDLHQALRKEERRQKQ